MRLALLIVFGSLLLYLDSCKEVVGPVPEFQFEFDDFDDIGVTAFDTTTIQLNGLPISPGTVTNEEFDAFTTLSEAEVNNLVVIYDGAISDSERAFWESQTQASSLSSISSGELSFLAQLQSIETTFANNPSLAIYLPSSTSPSNGRIAARVDDDTQPGTGTNPVSDPSGIENDFDDCILAAQEIFEETVARLETERDDELAKIEVRYQNLLATVNDQNTQAVERHDARLAAFLTTYEAIVSFISDLVTAGDITSEAGDDALLLALNVYSFSISSSFDVLQAEQALIADAEEDLNTQRDDAVNSVQSDYSNQLNEATATRNSTQAQCHNQGSGSGQ